MLQPDDDEFMVKILEGINFDEDEPHLIAENLSLDEFAGLHPGLKIPSADSVDLGFSPRQRSAKVPCEGNTGPRVSSKEIGELNYAVGTSDSLSAAERDDLYKRMNELEKKMDDMATAVMSAVTHMNDQADDAKIHYTAGWKPTKSERGYMFVGLMVLSLYAMFFIAGLVPLFVGK